MAVLFADERFFEHDTGNHPESAARLKGIYARLDEKKLRERFEQGKFEPATAEQLQRVHTPEYVKRVEQLADRGGGMLDPDTVVSRRSYAVATLAAGTGVAAVDAVIKGGQATAVCLQRPPGHHARADAAMGFCLFNNIAIAAEHARQAHGLSRLLIVDWDVHHGNGTQEIFYESGEVYFFSAHRYPFYPGTGTEDETGAGPGLGTIFNLPLRYGISRDDYRTRFQLKLEQAAGRCKPELILVSAGFDAHADDPIGSLGLASDDFAALTKLVCDAADQYAGGRMVSLLEGGYNVQALAESVEFHLTALLDHERASGKMGFQTHGGTE